MAGVKEKPKFYRRKRNIIIALVFAALVTWMVLAFGGEEAQSLRTETIAEADLIQEVSVTGSVKPAEKVSLGFEVSGKVAEIYAEVGDRVEAGERLISLSSNDILAQFRQAQAGVSSASAMLQQYQAALDAQNAKLDEMRSGTRPEEIRIAETNVETAEKALEDSEKNLQITISKAEVDLASTYNSALLSLFEAVNTGKAALITLTEIQFEHFITTNQDRYVVEGAKAEAVFALLGISGAGAQSVNNISKMNGGTYGEVQALGINASQEEIEESLFSTLNALQKVKYALDIVPIKIDFSEAELLDLDTEKANINSDITTLSGHRNLITIQEVTNENLINVAETAINSAASALSSAEDQLNLKKAGYTQDQIKAQEALVNQAAANLTSQRAQVSQAYANSQNYQAQLDKTVLYAPITGLITKMEAKVGEIVFPSSPYSDSRTTFVSIISDRDYEIEASVAEVDIAKISIGDMSKVTLDAYGDEVLFEAQVTAIDPAETLIEGIPTYKVTLQFINETEKIKSGMTANLDILTNKLEDVISIPQRAVITKDGKKIVRILQEDSDLAISEMTTENIVEVEVETGIKSSDGRIEITKGLNSGDVIVISID